MNTGSSGMLVKNTRLMPDRCLPYDTDRLGQVIDGRRERVQTTLPSNTSNLILTFCVSHFGKGLIPRSPESCCV